MERLRNTEELQSLRDRLAATQDGNKSCVRICMTGCRARGAEQVRDAFREELERQGLGDEVEVRETGCQGFCAQAPVIVVEPQGFFYQQLAPKDVSAVVSETLKEGRVVERLLFPDPQSGQRIVYESDIPFYRGQQKNVLRNCGVIDPTDISGYIARGGYSALEKVLGRMGPEEVVSQVTESGLRGRGGAGFPTGRKWGFARSAPGDVKYLVCNGSEGDPGAFMDRALMEGDPHSVLEGMLIAAYAIGANTGYIYVGSQKPIAVEHLKIALAQAQELGLVGENILGSGFGFEIRIKEGAGAYVCGEETGLIASLEGRTGEPRPRPPYPAVSGLWGKPTNINNVETYANVPLIILNGADEYASVGTEQGKGTKIFSLAGKVNNTGLVEVPIGIPLRDVVFDIGGGVPGGKKFKAVQMGGPSGGCVPEMHLSLPVDYGSLEAIGATMGAGGMVVMDEDTCMVDMALYFLSFLEGESCGKCVPCREGIRRMRQILADISEGRGTEGDIERLERLATAVADGSLCALGGTAPNTVLSTIRYFRDEYDEHIKNHRCPAGICKALIS
ncbi:MAG: NuoF family protein [Chloroflexota bacterium]